MNRLPNISPLPTQQSRIQDHYRQGGWGSACLPACLSLSSPHSPPPLPVSLSLTHRLSGGCQEPDGNPGVVYRTGPRGTPACSKRAAGACVAARRSTVGTERERLILSRVNLLFQHALRPPTGLNSGQTGRSATGWRRVCVRGSTTFASCSSRAPAMQLWPIRQQVSVQGTLPGPRVR